MAPIPWAVGVSGFRARDSVAASWRRRTHDHMSRHASARSTSASGPGHKPPTSWTKATIMITAVSASTLPQHQARQAATPATAMAETDSLRRWQRALDMLLTQRGDAFAEVERVLADDPGSVFG